MKNKVNKNKKGFVLAYASVLMAVIMILIAGITSLIKVMSENNSRISDSFYESVAVDQTLEYFLSQEMEEEYITEYAEENGLEVKFVSNADSTERILLIYQAESEFLLLEVAIATSGENLGKITYLSYGER